METGWRYVLKRLLLIILVALLCALALAIGLMLGYGVIGDGDNPLTILSPEKWQELIRKFTGQ